MQLVDLFSAVLSSATSPTDLISAWLIYFRILKISYIKESLTNVMFVSHFYFLPYFLILWTSITFYKSDLCSFYQNWLPRSDFSKLCTFQHRLIYFQNWLIYFQRIILSREGGWSIFTLEFLSVDLFSLRVDLFSVDLFSDLSEIFSGWSIFAMKCAKSMKTPFEKRFYGFYAFSWILNYDHVPNKWF